jgi:hypothetical protein
MRMALHIICVLGLLFSVLPPLRAQRRLRLALIAPANQEIVTNCENNIAVLGGIAQSTAPEDLMIVISRLGEDETKRHLNRRRLHNIRIYLTSYLTVAGGRRRAETIILAEGERVKGYGRLELYVGGKLAYVFKMKRNADLLVGNCGSEPPAKPCPPEERNLYPCRDKYLKYQKRSSH